MMKKIALAILAFAFISCLSENAAACSCVSDAPSAEVKETDAVFIGRILSELTPNDSWKVKVTSVIKGDVKEEIRLFATMKGTSCESSNYKVGETYVFFMDKLTEENLRDEDGVIAQSDYEKIGHYQVRVCSWTALLSEWKTDSYYRDRLKEFKDEGFLRMLSKGRKPRKGN